MKKQLLKVLASFLAVVMLVSQLMPATASAFSNSIAQKDGIFYFMAVADGECSAKPVKVNYSSGDTILAALRKTKNIFVLDGSKVISINDVKGSYQSYANPSPSGEVDNLNANPEVLSDKLLVMSNEKLTISNNLELLVKEINRYENSKLAQQYTVAVNLYQGIIGDLAKKIRIDSLITDYYHSLKQAIDDAEGQFIGNTCLVGNVLTHGSSTLAADQASVEFKNIYGTSFHAKAGEVIPLLPGVYNYIASIPELGKKATGSFEVLPLSKDGSKTDTEKQQVLNLNFPGDEYWISGACFGLEDDSSLTKISPVCGLKFDVPVVDNCADSNLFTGLSWSAEALKFDSAYRAVTVNYRDTNDEVQNKTVSNSSSMTNASTALPNFIPKDGRGRKQSYLATLNDVEKSIVYTQEYTLNLERSPRTLQNVQVADETSFVPISPAFNPAVNNYTVTVLDTNTLLKIYPTAFSSYKNGYRVLVNGVPVDEGGFLAVPLKAKGETQNPIQITIRYNDESKESSYFITPILAKSVEYNFSIPKGSNIVVKNSVGGKAALTKSDLKDEKIDQYSFRLAEGQPYSYCVTQNSYYQTLGKIIAENGSKEVTVDTEDHIEHFQMLEKSTSEPYLNYEPKNKVPNKMSATIPDYATTAMMKVTLKEGVTGYEMNAHYISQTANIRTNGISTAVNISNQTNTTLTNFIRSSATNQDCDLIVSKVEGEFTRQQVYKVHLKRELSLSANAAPIFVNNTTGNLQSVYYTPSWNQNHYSGYELSVPDDSKSLIVTLGQNGSVLEEAFQDPAYKITVNGVDTEKASAWTAMSPLRQATIPLSGTKADEKIVIQLSHPSCASTKYEFKVKKVKSIQMSFEIDPKDARFTLSDVEGSRLWPGKDGKYRVLEGEEYKYVLSKADYVTLSDSFKADVNCTKLKLSIKKASKNDKIDPTIDVEWNKFRGEDNNGVTKRATPANAEEAQLRWAYLTGGMSHVGQPIVLDNYVAVLKGTMLQYLDPISGKLVAEGKLSSSCGVVPVFSNGMIFVPESSALQAFNATPRPQTENDTGYTNKEVMVLDSLWVYKDPIGGAGTTPFYVKDGYIYGGWQQVRRNGAFVCLSITDEDPQQTNETKEATWRWVRKKGGFYWAGAHVSDRFVVVGGEKSGEDDLVCMNTATGEVLDRLSNIFNTENRGCVSYDKGTDRYCLVTKDEFFSVRVDKDGKFYSLKRASLGGMSTSTPAIYNGRAYIGCSGNGQFQAFTGAGIMVIDVESAQPVYAMKTRGYPQSSGLISTAYMDVPHYNPQTDQMEKGFVYVYFDENVNPGNISYIIDKPGITAPVKSENVGGIETAPLLFAPKGAHAQYCLSSLQVDKYGTLYMKTDAGYILAIGSKIESLEVTQNPHKTVYMPGEKFDPAGMKVYAKYLNGTKLDVTDYVTPMYEDSSGGVLNVKQSTMTLKFNNALYNNSTPNDYIDSNKNSTFDKLPRPEVAVPIVVLGDEQVRQVDEVIDMIDSIGEVGFSTDSKEKIDLARKACAGIDPNLRPAIKNFKVLQDAEERYDRLLIASQNKLPLSNAAEDAADRLSLSVPGSVKLNTPAKDLIQMFTLNLEELLAVESGAPIHIGVDKKQLNRVPDTEEFMLGATLQKKKLVEAGSVFDLSMFKKIGNLKQEHVSELYDNQKVRIEIPIPENCRSDHRLFYLVNIHGSEVNILRDLAPEDHTKVVIETGMFSTYVLTYAWLDTKADKPLPTPTTEKIIFGDEQLKTSVRGGEVKTASGEPAVDKKSSMVTEEKTEEIKTADKKELDQRDDNKDELTKNPSSITAKEDLAPAGKKLALILWISGAFVLIIGGIVVFNQVKKKKFPKK